MMKLRISYSVIFFVSLLSGCASTYVPSPDVTTIKINLKNANFAPWICRGDGPKRLKVDEDGFAQIPVGERIIIGNSFFSQNGGGMITITYACRPRISFIPRMGEKYIANLELDNRRCRFQVFKEDDENPIGLTYEKSVAALAGCG